MLGWQGLRSEQWVLCVWSTQHGCSCGHVAEQKVCGKCGWAILEPGLVGIGSCIFLSQVVFTAGVLVFIRRWLGSGMRDGRIVLLAGILVVGQQDSLCRQVGVGWLLG